MLIGIFIGLILGVIICGFLSYLKIKGLKEVIKMYRVHQDDLLAELREERKG